jgi:DNA-directed RNA polymerase specialized sigma24 family protein
MNPLCAVVWVLAIALIPLLIMQRISETEKQKIRRLRSSGWTLKRIAERLDVSVYKVRKSLAAAKSC